MLHPKNCKKCGGKKQAGGTIPKQSDYPDYESYSQALSAWIAQQVGTQESSPHIDLSKFITPVDESMIPGLDSSDMSTGPKYDNRIHEGISKGIIGAPRDWNGTAMEWYNFMNTNQPQKKNNKTPQNTLQNIGITLQGLRTGLGEIAGKVERGRQNQYDYLQQTALGMMNAMPTTDYQPNPYSLYAKYGGSLKKYQQGGINVMNIHQDNVNKLKKELNPLPTFYGLNNWSGQKPTSDDSLTYNNNFQRALLMPSNDVEAQKLRAEYTKFNASSPVIQNMAANESSAFTDAMKQKQLADEQFVRRLYLSQNVSKKPMKYGGLQHVNYFGPPFSNGAKMNMGDSEKIDKQLIIRKIIPKLFNAFPYKQSKFIMTMKKGGLTPNKARQILHDGTAQGKPLTDKQRRFFGAMSKGHTNYRGK